MGFSYPRAQARSLGFLVSTRSASTGSKSRCAKRTHSGMDRKLAVAERVLHQPSREAELPNIRAQAEVGHAESIRVARGQGDLDFLRNLHKQILKRRPLDAHLHQAPLIVRGKLTQARRQVF